MLRAIEKSISKLSIHTPGGFEKRDYTPAEKKKVLDYMKSIEPCASCGRIFDCEKMKDTELENVGFDDGSFIWTSQDRYHVDRYNASVTNAFIDHINAVLA